LSMWGHGIENPTSVFVIDTDGQDLRELTVDGEYEYSYAGRPKWSPDGRHILYIGDYTSKEGSGVNALFVVNVETGEQRKLVDGVEVTDFLWSPDGQEIAFYSGKDHLLCKVSISDGKVTKLADKGLGVLAWK
jgi:Tol biopolymer transport system component